MSRPAIQVIKLSPDVSLCECHPDSECRTVNWWLYDKRASMNISMHAKTREAALFEALTYWAERAALYYKSYNDLKSQVDEFVGRFAEQPEE